MADNPVSDRDAMRSMAAALGNRANALAAEGRVAEVPALWEEAIAALADEASRARITLAYAWYQALHGDVEHGVRLAAGLRECFVPQVRGQIRVLVRGRARLAPEVVERAWRASTGSGLPEWSRLPDEVIELVAAWVAAVSWGESRKLFESRIARLRSQDIDAALTEIALGAPGLTALIGVHEAVLTLGGEAGYRCVDDPRQAATAAAAAIEAGDWEALAACATIERRVHRLAYLGGAHGMAASAMTGGELVMSPALAERVADLAEDAQRWELAQATADLAAIGDDRVRPMLGLLESHSR